MASTGRLEELRDRLRQLEAARGTMDDAVLDGIVRDTEAELRRLEAAGGGGEAPAEAGSRSVTITGDAAGVTIVTGDGNRILAAEAEPELLFEAYLGALAGECGKLPLAAIDSQFVRAGGERAVKLPEVYVELDATVSERPPEGGETAASGGRDWAWRLVRGEAAGRRPVRAALARPEARRCVLLGDPGSGKTTLAHLLCHDLARGGDTLAEPLAGLVPVRFVLREVAAHLPADAASGGVGMLWDALAAGLAELLGGDGAARLRPHLEQRMRQDGAFVVLDGLDEVPAAHRRRRVLLEAIAAFADSLAAGPSRILVTARPYAYADRRWHLEGFEILALAPFDGGQVERFLDRWYRVAARRAFGWNAATAEAKGRQLREALTARPYLGDLASRPLLLTLMATLHSSWGQLPEDRADLYEETVKLLLSRWQRAREVRAPGGEAVVEEAVARVLEVGESQLRAALERLAYAVHRRQGGEAGRGEEPADISRGELLAAFEPLLEKVEARQLIAYLEQRAGLLVGRREDVFAFPHRSFQEYLAACHLGSLEDPAERIREHAMADAAWWREVVLLAVNRSKRSGLGNAVGVLAVLQPASPAEPAAAADDRWRLAVLCGHAVLELRLVEAAAKAARADKPDKPHYGVAVERARRWLTALVEGGRLTAKERLEAGDVLGRLDDPRPGVGLTVVKGSADAEAELPGVAWVEVPAGEFTMGSGEDDELAWGAERPAHSLELERFWISRYPVTHQQFRPFIEAGGYDNRGFWGEPGWAWRQGREPEADLSIYPKEHRQAIADWLAGRPLEKRDRPFFWQDPRWSAVTRPVVGVSWFEALAFSRWLQARYRDLGAVPGLEGVPVGTVCLGLPSEAQWEKAARAPRESRWPWGDGFEPGRCNSSESELQETSPVGIFPSGNSGLGLADMAGNVWEWTTTIWDEERFSYPYSPGDGRNEVESHKLRVLRGGSYYEEKKVARCAARDGDHPENFDNGIGFRVVLSLANSEY